MYKQTALMLGILLVALTATADAQTCRSDIAASAPDSRFRDNGDGTVSDLWTGLMWKQCAEGLAGGDCRAGSALRISWQRALERADNATDAGYLDWRLPNRNELASLIEERCVDPAINSRFFPNTPSLWARLFWSSSPYAYSQPGHAWVVTFYHGHVSSHHKTLTVYVRLVRDGQ